jgi:palmitoyltransferase ZDHHC9/14/18
MYRDLLIEAGLTPAQTCARLGVPGAKPIRFLLIFLLLNLLSVLILISGLTGAHSTASIILTTATQLLANIFLMQTFQTEPGIIPKNIEKICPSITLLQNSVIITPQLLPQDPPKSHIFPNQTNPVKFCSQCQIYRPNRTIHCKFCNNCVFELDHHCKWLGCCIGKRNQKFFIFWICAQGANSCLGFCVNFSIGQNFGSLGQICRVGFGLLCLGVTVRFVGL